MMSEQSAYPLPGGVAECYTGGMMKGVGPSASLRMKHEHEVQVSDTTKLL